jgi:hypothetical protein
MSQSRLNPELELRPQVRHPDRPVTFPVRPEAFPLAADPARPELEHPELVRPVVASARLVAQPRVVLAADSLVRPEAAVAVVGQAAVAAVERTHSTR